MSESRGIISYGAYLPRHRLPREAIRQTLGHGGGRGSRTVAGYDEDTTSMAVEAGRRARWNGAFTPSSLHFATTAPSYADKTNATAIHAALRLASDVFAADHAGSMRSAVAALRAAAVDGGLAVLSDIRLGRPGSADEAGGGDGAAHGAAGEHHLGLHRRAAAAVPDPAAMDVDDFGFAQRVSSQHLIQHSMRHARPRAGPPAPPARRGRCGGRFHGRRRW